MWMTGTTALRQLQTSSMVYGWERGRMVCEVRKASPAPTSISAAPCSSQRSLLLDLFVPHAGQPVAVCEICARVMSGFALQESCQDQRTASPRW